MKKQWTMVIMFMTIFLLFLVGANAETVCRVNETQSIAGIYTDQNNGVYILTSEALYHWDAEKNQSECEMVTADVENIAVLVAATDRLYAVRTDHEIVYWVGDAWAMLRESQPDKPELRNGKADAAYDRLFYTYRDENDRIYLQSFEFSTGNVEEQIGFPQRQFCYDAQLDRLVCLSDEQSEEGEMLLLSYDYRTGKVDGSYPIRRLNANIKAWAYNAKEGMYYFSTRDRVYQYALNGSAEVFCNEQSGIMTAFGKGQIALVGFQDGWEVQVFGASENETTLVMLNHYTVYADDFTRQTGIQVVSQNVQGESAMWDISQLMSTRDPSVDIFAFFMDEGLEQVKRKGYFASLDGSAVLAQAENELYPAIARHLRTENGVLAVWPVYAEALYRMTDTAMLNKYGYEAPTTFDELLDIIPAILESDLLRDEEYVLFDTMAYTRGDMFVYLVQNYMLTCMTKGVQVDFNTDTFRHLAQRVLTEPGETDPCPRGEEGTEEALFALTCGCNVITPNILPPLRLSEEDGGILTDVTVLAVNPYSEHQQEAIAFLEFMATKRTAEDYGLYASMTEPLAYPGAQEHLDDLRAQESALLAQTDGMDETERQDKLAALRLEIADAETYLYQVSPETIANYHRLSEQFVVLEEAMAVDGQRLQGLIAMTAEGDFPLEDFIRQANEYVWMVEAERGGN